MGRNMTFGKYSLSLHFLLLSLDSASMLLYVGTCDGTSYYIWAVLKKCKGSEILLPRRSDHTFLFFPDLAQLPQLRPHQRDRDHHHDRADAAADHGEDRCCQRRQRAGLEGTQFVGRSDECAFHGVDTTTHGIGCFDQLQRFANDHAYAI